MNLGRLSQPAARSWRAPALLAAALLAMQSFGGGALEALRYDRVAILGGGEYARLVTGHLVHLGWTHLAWNLAGFALVAWLCAREFPPRSWAIILVASTIAVDLGFLVLEPQLAWYVGFSGVLHGLMAAGLCAWLCRGPDALTAVIGLLFALKLGWEHLVGPLPFTAGTLDAPVIHAAHTYGAVGGASAALVLLWRERAAGRSL